MVDVATVTAESGADRTYLPQPPDNEEKHLYYGPQQRWIFCVCLLAFAGVMYGMARLALNSMWTSLLYELMAVQLVAVLISLRSSTRRRRGTLAQHQHRVAAYRPTDFPSVDVLLPSAGEPVAVLANTYRHVARLIWPGRLRVYVLDDSARPYVAELARQHGFIYLSRPNRGELKKAGNLKYGFAHSDGDLIHVFDADFVPRPEMILELAPYFDDPAVGIVQSPQYFDVTNERFNWLQRAAGATQELFYRWVQPARDAVDAAICVGTNAVYRRRALLAAGGFAQIGHSEDVHTGVNLAKVGYKTRYVPVNLAKGICPDNFDGFANQQYRWCTGSMSLLADPGFHRSRLSPAQKLCFWTGFLYYITTAIAAFTSQLPGLLMLWCFPDQIRPMNYLPLVGTVFVWSTLMPRVTNYRWSPIVVRIQLLIGFCHAVALYDFLRGRTAAWVPTGAAGQADPAGPTDSVAHRRGTRDQASTSTRTASTRAAAPTRTASTRAAAPTRTASTRTASTRTARRVLRTLRLWLVTAQALTWIGICYRLLDGHGPAMWATLLFSLPMLYFAVPLILGDRGVGEPGRRTVATLTPRTAP